VSAIDPEALLAAYRRMLDAAIKRLLAAPVDEVEPDLRPEPEP
jgi:hypothetical protein